MDCVFGVISWGGIDKFLRSQSGMYVRLVSDTAKRDSVFLISPVSPLAFTHEEPDAEPDHSRHDYTHGNTDPDFQRGVILSPFPTSACIVFGDSRVVYHIAAIDIDIPTGGRT